MPEDTRNPRCHDNASIFRNLLESIVTPPMSGIAISNYRRQKRLDRLTGTVACSSVKQRLR